MFQRLIRIALAAWLLTPQLKLPAFDVVEKSIDELQTALERRQVTSRQLVELYLARIDAYDQKGPTLNTFIALNPRAIDDAVALDTERARGRVRGPLHGIPIVVKDNFDTADMPTTGGSIALATLQPAADAVQVERLRRAGAIIIGKTNLHELAAGIVTVSSLGGQTRNPYDPARNPGGSSGGTGAAIAANFAAAGLGSDTCGSIRIPASHNNLVGLRPTKGVTDERGVMPLSHTQDVAGPLARSIEDLAIMLEGVGALSVEPLSNASVRGVRIGVLTSLFGNAAEDAEAAAIVRQAIDRMRNAGAVIVDADIPQLSDALSGSSVIDHEFKFDLEDYLSAFKNPPVRSLGEILERGLHHQALEATFRRRNAAAARETPAYQAARAKRAEVLGVMTSAFDKFQVRAFVYPTMKRKPAPIGEAQAGSNCQLSPSTGLPALSVPAGFTADGLPLGIEFLGRANGDAELLRLGAALERLARIRRAPPATPPLQAGASIQPVVAPQRIPAPASSTPELKATFTVVSGDRLAYQIGVVGVQASSVTAVTVRRMEASDRLGAVIARLMRPGQSESSGELPLRKMDLEDLNAGRLYLQLFTRSEPFGSVRLPISARR